MLGLVQRADVRDLRLLDAIIVFWCTLCIVVGVWVGYEIWQLGRLGTSIVQSGQALDSSGRALQELRGLPLIGDTPGTIGDEVRRTGADVAASGGQARESIRRLGILLGLATVLVPLAPVLLLYLPFRVGRRSDLRGVRRMLGRGDQRDVETYLASRALAAIPYERLRRVTPAPWTDFEEGRHKDLADAELRRLGLRRSEDPSGPPVPSSASGR